MLMGASGRSCQQHASNNENVDYAANRTVAITPMRSRSLPWDEVKKVCQTNTMAGMEAIHGAGINKPFRFLYMSGAAAPRDQTQKPRFMADYGLMRVSWLDFQIAFRNEDWTNVIDVRAKPKTWFSSMPQRMVGKPQLQSQA